MKSGPNDWIRLALPTCLNEENPIEKLDFPAGILKAMLSFDVLQFPSKYAIIEFP